jgi:hypothetical protein
MLMVYYLAQALLQQQSFLKFYFMSQSVDKETLPDESATWICFECAKERGYRRPLEGSVNDTVTKCVCCSKYCVVMDRDDLIPPGE